MEDCLRNNLVIRLVQVALGWSMTSNGQRNELHAICEDCLGLYKTAGLKVCTSSCRFLVLVSGTLVYSRGEEREEAKEVEEMEATGTPGRPPLSRPSYGMTSSPPPSPRLAELYMQDVMHVLGSMHSCSWYQCLDGLFDSCKQKLMQPLLELRMY